MAKVNFSMICTIVELLGFPEADLHGLHYIPSAVAPFSPHEIYTR